MAISRTPKKVEAENNYTPMAQVFEDVDNEDKTNEVDEVAELKAQLAELQSKVNERDADIPYLQAPSYQSQTVQSPVDVDPNTVQLPDPVQYPDEYAAAVEKRIEIRHQNKSRREDFDAKNKNDLQSKLGELWADFGEAYPEMVENKDRIDYIAQKLAVDAAKRGLDPQKYMFGTRNRFMKDVAKLYVSTFGDPAVDEEDDDDLPPPRSRKAHSTPRRRAANRNREEEDDGRSSGIFGGNESGSRPSRRGVDADEHNTPSMLDDIHTMQKKSGFF